MASGLKTAINDVLAGVRAIPYDWDAASIQRSNPTLLFQCVRIWNDQVSREAKGGDNGVMGYTFEKPACFVELINMGNSMLLDGVSTADYTWRFHIVDYELDDANGNFDQNLNVITYRDMVKQAMAGFQPSQCSTLFPIDEAQDTTHTEVYHYTLDLRCLFQDTKGTGLDPDQTRYITKEPPTNLVLITEFDSSVTPEPDPHTSYIWEVYEVRALIVETPNSSNTQTLGNGAEIPLEYAIEEDGTIIIPYLISIGGIYPVAPFEIDGNIMQGVTWDAVTGKFDNSANGGFLTGNIINFNASLPNL